ncbi:hypothetical protein EFZ62_16165 [Serratia marcescens]|uniref:hypothetical protein n=1 Tax=Serratia marcescens TaxID=615 RepID=UPI001316A623|nr:hypothetical protein [Serratia marcescens]QHC46415.1 hypothetical protein EFZ62_16165 [Serratia marcescens]
MALTAAEKKWVNDVQKVLNRCPSKRLGFATAGDSDITVYDSSFSELIFKTLEHEGGDYIPTATKLGAVLGVINFPSPVESTAA